MRVAEAASGQASAAAAIAEPNARMTEAPGLVCGGLPRARFGVGVQPGRGKPTLVCGGLRTPYLYLTLGVTCPASLAAGGNLPPQVWVGV